MKYINQKQYPDIPYITRTSMEGEDYAWGQNTTVSSSGCGLCAAIMVADRLLPNCQFGLEDALALSYGSKANHRKGTDYARFAPAFAEKLGLRMEASDDLEDVRRCLRTGGAAVLLIQGDRDGKTGIFAHGGHYITAINEEPDGRIAILDPYFYEGKYEEEGRKGVVEVTRGKIILSEGKYIQQEASVKSKPYYMFWR